MSENVASECTILFADLIGSVLLYQRVGDEKAFLCLSLVLDVIRHGIESHGGIINKHTGDGFMASFSHPDRAAEAAMEIHRELELLGKTQECFVHDLAVRIGFHHGSVIVNGNDIFGDTVNCAARLLEMASAGRAVMTEDAALRLSGQWKGHMNVLPRRALRGTDTTASLLDLYELRCSRFGDLTVLDLAFWQNNKVQMQLCLRIGEQLVVLDEDCPLVRLGRDEDMDICVADLRVSRMHAEIQIRGDQFVLIDYSSNATFIQPADGESFVLSHESMVLPLNGKMTLGVGVGLAGIENTIFFNVRHSALHRDHAASTQRAFA